MTLSSDVPYFLVKTYVRVTVHRNKLLYNKTNRRTDFPNSLFSQNKFGKSVRLLVSL